MLTRLRHYSISWRSVTCLDRMFRFGSAFYHEQKLFGNISKTKTKIRKKDSKSVEKLREKLLI